jgi:hypothetical protein
MYPPPNTIKGKKEKETKSWALVAYACNPSYSGGLQLEASLSK